MKKKLIVIIILGLMLSSMYYVFNYQEVVYRRQPQTYKEKRLFLEKASEIVDEKTNEVEQSSIVNVKLELKQRVQENAYFCVPAALQMVLDFNNITLSQEELAHEMNTSPVTGTEYVDLARVANKYLFDNQPGYHVQTLGLNGMSNQEKQDFESRVRLNISTQDPTFVAIDNQAMYETLSVGNHMIVVVGYNLNTQTDRIESYIFIDPSYIVQDSQMQGLKVVSSEGMFKAISQNEEPAYVY